MLFQPAGLLDTLLVWLDAIRRRAEECQKEMRIKGDARLEELRKKNNEIWGEVADKLYILLVSSLIFMSRNVVHPVGIPVILLGTKYDLYQDFDV